MTTLALFPRDGFSSKDGRGWYTSDIGRSRSHAWPMPNVLRGALRNAFGRERASQSGFDWQRDTEGVRIVKSCAVCRRVGEPLGAEHRMWPAPADAVQLRDDAEEGNVRRLIPTRTTRRAGGGTLGNRDDAAMEALWLPAIPRGKTQPSPMFWTDAEMIAWLTGQPVQRCDPRDPRRTPVVRTDIGLAINPDTQAAEPSMLRSSDITEGLVRAPSGVWEWGIVMEIALPGEATKLARGPLFVGGKRRLSFPEEISAPMFDGAPPLAPSRYVRLALATPADFAHGWIPDGFAAETIDGEPVYLGALPGVRGPVILRAAIVPRPVPLSTWDMVARAPRKTRLLVPAGSVYFVEKRGGDFTREELRALWLAQLGGARDEGLGLMMPGAWNPEEPTA